jgi:hypothetical protein
MPWFLTSIIGKENSQYESVPESKLNNQRTFGFYDDYRHAYLAVERNYANMEECLYDYLVMEYMEEGIHPTVHAEYWWQWNKEINCWKSLQEKPKEFVGIVNFALG